MTPDSRRLEAELQALLDASPDAVLIVDSAGLVVALNRRTESLFGIPGERLRGHPIETLVPPRLREAHAAARSAYGRAPTVRQMSGRKVLTGLRADGTEFPVEVSLTPVVGSDAGLVMAVVHEVAARSRIEHALEAEGPPTGALDAIPDAILTTDGAGRVDFVNAAAEHLTGWSRDTARGRSLPEVLPLIAERGGEPLESPVSDCLRSGRPGPPCEALLPSADGAEARVLDISTTPIRDQSGVVIGAAVVARDVTHARLIARQLSHQATHDALTGLVNRAEFERRLRRALTSAAEEQAEHALCFLDLDGFKRVNDACGHLAGDELLRQLSDLMRDRMRSRDTLARLGGDEFGMILEHCRLPKATRIAEQMLAAICAHQFAAGGETYAVGVSIGIVPIRAGGQPGDLLRAADGACYLAKRRGGNRVQLVDRRQRASKTLQNVDWVRRVVAAMEEERFSLYAQRLVSLEAADRRAPRLELLLRLAEGTGDPLLPGAFLPAVSRYGLMPRVDRWVIRHAVQRLADWQRSHPGTEHPVVSINFGDETVAGGEALVAVQAALAAADVGPGTLCFEIGESAAGAHPSACARLVGELRAAGCQITLEHCGTGMSAFTSLRRLGVDYLKIAGHIVRGVVHDPVDRALATALNDIGHALGIGTIGVEVESPEVLACLRRLGVDFAQGYDIGRPEPLEAALDRLAAATVGIPPGVTPGPRRAPS
jgi:diguanylate cyclase (GGDEF)-like protein/PAS domain S-box-containing protein